MFHRISKNESIAAHRTCAANACVRVQPQSIGCGMRPRSNTEKEMR
jgi:hypothetical protein